MIHPVEILIACTNFYGISSNIYLDIILSQSVGRTDTARLLQELYNTLINRKHVLVRD